MANNQFLASDDFASGSLAAGWSVWPNASGHEPQIVTGSPNVAESFAVGTGGGVVWEAITWPDNQTSEITVNNLLSTSNGSDITLFVRVNSAGTTGYQASINATGTGITVQILNYATGALLGSVTGLIVNPGDIFTLQAAGCAVTLYQNSIPIFFMADATFPGGGSPGFAVRVPVAGIITDAQVSSWRGYSCVQQDGIWQKQGPVLVPNATDLASSGQGFFG